MTTVFIVVGGILLLFGYLKLKFRARRHSAALNIVLAKATFDSLPPDQQIKVHERAMADLHEKLRGRFNDFDGEYDKFGCYAHAMAALGIPPVVKQYPRWFWVPNPFVDILPHDPLLDVAIAEIKRDHGIEVVVRRDSRLFDPIHAANREQKP